MSSPLLNLPAELRDEIYAHLFPPGKNYCNLFIHGNTTRFALANFKLQDRTGPDTESWKSAMEHSTALLRTCKQIRREATPYFEDSILYKITVEGLSPGSIGSKISEEEFCAVVKRMRRVVLVQQWRYGPYGSAAVSSPWTSAVGQVLLPLKRNTAILVNIVLGNARLKVESIDLNLYARIANSPCCVVSDVAVSLLKGLGRHPGVKVRNLAQPRDAVTTACVEKLVEALGGVDCTEHLRGEAVHLVTSLSF